MRHFITPLCTCLLFLHFRVTHAETVRLPITKDVGICAHPQEVTINTGGQARIRIKGHEHYYLFDFDTSAITNLRVVNATLHLKVANGCLRRIAACTVPVAWDEGTATGKSQDGASCFTHAKYPNIAWDEHGGTMLDVTFNSPRMDWAAFDVIAKEDPWVEVPIDPRLVEAVAAGLSHGLVLSEEKGQTRQNHDIFTREQSNAKPYLSIVGEPIPIPAPATARRPAPQSAPCPAAASLSTGAANIFPAWNQKRNILGHRITMDRQQIITFHDDPILFEDLEPGKTYHVTTETWLGSHVYQAVHDVKASPALSGSVPPTIPKIPCMESKSELGWTATFHGPSAVISATSSRVKQHDSIPVPAVPRNAWLGLAATIHPPKDDRGPVRVEVKKSIPCPVQIYRVWAVKRADQDFSEVLVPLREDEVFQIPWDKNAIGNQTCQPIFMDIWVPKDMEPGHYSVSMRIHHARGTLELPIQFEVTEIVLPDVFQIIGDMNTYDSPATAMGMATAASESFMPMERNYYRLAHAHRMTLNVLPYSQSGGINWRGAPVVQGGQITDWSQWDARYGPLLDGSAFATEAGYVGPGAGVPIHHLYLPFHENWPQPLAENFKPWPPPKDDDAFLKWTADLPPIEKCLERTIPYRTFTEHLMEKGWSNTWYQVYLNNKYYFREKGGRGISLWLLDEPMFPDDFLALRWFGNSLRQFKQSDSSNAAQDRLQFRIDISRPTHQRNWLDGVVDLNVCADQLYSQRRLIAYRKRAFGESYWNYQMPPSFHGSNFGWETWPVRSYCWGATGTLPWQTIASDGDLDTADETALIYPGRKFGLNEPLPSLRMKAWRQGLQTAELLHMLRVKEQWTDIQLRAFVGQVCGLGGWEAGMDPDASEPIVTFEACQPESFEHLRRAVMAALSSQHP
ncbi:MAG: DUF4091 domain-containing protein [Pirellulales bacterium]|nr:DUF4091 domain-containing protein [Pirellulales bacterium]